MAWTACNLFVRSADGDADQRAAILDAVELLLRSPEHHTDRSEIHDLPPPVTVSPAVDGWSVVAGLRPWIDDLLWAAQAVSSSASTTAIACELLGAFFRLRLAEYRGGERRHLVRTPDDIEWSSEAEHKGPMPLYEDAEQRAYGTLRGLGVPAELLAIGTRPLGCDEPRAIGEGTQLLLRGAAVEREPAPLSAPPFSGDDAPVLPREVGSDFGLSLFDERYVEGAPSNASIERLIALEEALGERARRVVPGSAPDVTITYHGGSHQEQLNAALRAHGRHVLISPRTDIPPWWQFWRYFGWRR